MITLSFGTGQFGRSESDGLGERRGMGTQNETRDWQTGTEINALADMVA